MHWPGHRRASAALVVSTVSLIVALGGTSYAAFTLPTNSVGTKQLKNKAVTLAKIAPTTRKALVGVPGAQGQQGPQGPPGPQGPAGPHGTQGPPGPVTGMAPSGITQRGAFYVDGYAPSGNTLGTSISFPLELASAPHPVEMPPGVPNPDPTHCPGTVDAPAAAPGYLCIYDSYSQNATNVVPPYLLLVYDVHAHGGANPFGASIFTYASTTGDVYVAGSWAVTAP